MATAVMEGAGKIICDGGEQAVEPGFAEIAFVNLEAESALATSMRRLGIGFARAAIIATAMYETQSFDKPVWSSH
jgi:hypothetical protein|tara:strand:+ start:99 stop:323 length:225 start_codon:yes stop_codon:yes gene_type:complete